ncbi:LL-diaminopimelate aminotransferase [Tetzosporium hominis]|uniref:Aminotransferase n=1 Tax=Tetzosporium hominis TaxID=2020506 RepID=A0A264W2U3_9BACL|nr:aminotransferase class I/II-fold pyridoxal phosphate-dependent enzyme [Tetzosporium hominis]OZS77875.1 LL-diaminopimelate aminotransferase [Tetzosporium hominis]
MNFQPATRMERFPTSIFGELKKAATVRVSNDLPVYDLSLGSPDLPPAEAVRQTLSEKSALATSYGYTLTGTSRFYEAVATYYKNRMGVTLDPETEIIQTMGSQEGLVHLPLAFCNEGDIVLTTNPAYVAYDAGIHVAGATPYYLSLDEENGFLPDIASIPDDIADQAKLLILNLPGNPVPALPSETFFKDVVAFAEKHNIIVVHDAAYAEFYFDGSGPKSFLATPGAKEVGLEINSLSKTFSLAGARIAYIAGNADLIAVIKSLKSHLDYGIFEPIQEAAITALSHADEITDNLRRVFSERHQVLKQGLEELGWKVAPSNGGMFIWAAYPYPMKDTEFVFHVLRETGVVMVPGSIFGTEGDGFARIALVKDVEMLKQALEALKTLQPIEVG